MKRALGSLAPTRSPRPIRALGWVPSFAPVALLSLASLVTGCGGASVVERAYAGRVVDGRFIDPDAYAAFLNGAMAYAGGDVRGALGQYDRAARLDGASPETWTRIGAMRCMLEVRDPRAGDAFARALALDPDYAGAWAAKAACASARHDEPAMVAAAQRALELDPSADGASVLLAGAHPSAPGSPTRDALVAMTATARDRPAAWDALAAWAVSRGDVGLWAVALANGVKVAPARRDAVAHSAEELAGAGQMSAARSVAAAAVDAGEGPFDEDRQPLAARLAVDEAIERGDAGVLRARSTRARVGLEEAAARGSLGDHRALGREIASGVMRADPAAVVARLVLAACDGRDLVAIASEARRNGARASGAVGVAVGAALVRAGAMEDARATVAALAANAPDAPQAPIVAGDDRVVRAAVVLVSRGVLDPGALPPDGLVEVAVLRGLAPGEAPSIPELTRLDARHQYLALALIDPKGARTLDLAARLAEGALVDPVVAAAAALVQIGGGATLDAGAARALLDRDPTDPLLAAVALRLADRTGDAEVATRARATLTALGPRPVHPDASSGPASPTKPGVAF